MAIIDISWPISPQMTTYKNRCDVSLEAVRNFEQHHSSESRLSCNLHTGTHVDAPRHFLSAGKTVDQMNWQSLLGICQVVDLTEVIECIDLEDLLKLKLDFERAKIILLKTRNSFNAPTEMFDANFVYLSARAAQWLAQQSIAAVGIDGLGIERLQPDHATHLAFMNRDIWIIEGLRLAQVAAGFYELICLPLNLIGVEAAPVRAFLQTTI